MLSWSLRVAVLPADTPLMSRRSISLGAFLPSERPVTCEVLAVAAGRSGATAHQCTVILEWRRGLMDEGPAAWFTTVTLAACVVSTSLCSTAGRAASPRDFIERAKIVYAMISAWRSVILVSGAEGV
jgi:hypothetical protein